MDSERFFFSSALVLLFANLTEEKLIIIKCKSKGFREKEYFVYSQKSARLYTYSNWRETYIKRKLSYRKYENTSDPTLNLSSIFNGNRLKIKEIESYSENSLWFWKYWTIKDAKKIKGSYDAIYKNDFKQEEHKMTCKLHDTYSLG